LPSRFAEGLGPAKPFAVGKLHPGKVERPGVRAGNRQRFLKQPDGDLVTPPRLA
jgi:hypothetical protein